MDTTKRRRGVRLITGTSLTVAVSVAQVWSQYALNEQSIDTLVFHPRGHSAVYNELTADTSVDLSYGLPPVGSQGGQNCCVAWAVGYYYKTWQETRKRRWDPSLPEHQFSPAFVYNQINGGVDGGSSIPDAFLVLLRMGCASLAICSYDQSDYQTWPTPTAYIEAMQYEVDSLFNTAWFDLVGVKQLLLSNEIGVMRVGVYDSFYNLTAVDPIYCISQLSGSLRFNHAVTIIGFDDRKITPDGIGALRCVNQWGPSWGDGGFFWLSYQMFINSNHYAGPVFFTKNKDNYVPKLVLRANVSHQRSGTVFLTAGLGDPASSIASKVWNQGLYDFSPDISVRPYPLSDLPIDISEFVPHLNSSPSVIFLSAYDIHRDSVWGMINSAHVEWLKTGIVISSTVGPVVIPDSGRATYSIGGIVNSLSTYKSSDVSWDLSQNYPNPFNPSTTIRYALPQRSHVTLTVFNTLGQLVATVVNDEEQAGAHESKFDGLNLASGIYFYRLSAGSFVKTMKCLLMK